MSNYVVRCPNCGKFRRTSSKKVVKCFSCGKSIDVKKHAVSESEYAMDVNRHEVDFK